MFWLGRGSEGIAKGRKRERERKMTFTEVGLRIPLRRGGRNVRRQRALQDRKCSSSQAASASDSGGGGDWR